MKYNKIKSKTNAYECFNRLVIKQCFRLYVRIINAISTFRNIDKTWFCHKSVRFYSPRGLFVLYFYEMAARCPPLPFLPGYSFDPNVSMLTQEKIEC